ncbi:VgrG-related protein [Actinotalea sp. K2]|uniref:VgrG-related protein n=1 Tax=Actinotalea sp. K2 TaxID=2939438 RepID=UPI00201814BF|nr:VgrG-related protein [Actinotalea sp. K2]MCL3860417.1 VgrG-related protein [Actinotalea sp. K2]
MTETWSAVPEVTIDSSEPDAALRRNLAEVDVDERLGVPTSVRVVLRDADRDLLTATGLTIGAGLAVRAGPVGAPAGELLAEVEVVALEVAYSDTESTVTVVGYDVSHRLHRFRRTRSFQDVTDGDVLRSVAQEVGLDVGTVDDPGVVHAHLAQVDSTDWDFLASRAREGGRVLRVRGSRLDLVAHEQASSAPSPGTLASTEPAQLVLGRDVEALRARVTSAEVPAEVEVRGWSVQTKEVFVATASVAAPGTEIGVAPGELAGRVGAPVLVVADRAISSQEEADAVARAFGDAAGSTFATARAVCSGDPRLRAGSAVSLGLAGDLVSGRWTVTAAQHHFDAVRGYRTTVDLGGLPGSGTGAAGPPHGNGRARGGVGGVVPAVVTDIDDDEALARVRVSLPWLSEGYVSDWARVAQPGAGPDRGTLLLPEVEDEVLVAFERGDVRRPYVIGGLWNGQDRPPLEAGAVDRASGESGRRGLVSRAGHRIVLDDADPSGILVATGDDTVQVRLDDTTGDLGVKADGAVQVTAGTVEVSARSITLTGDAEVTVSAPNITVEADGTLTLRGGVVRIN